MPVRNNISTTAAADGASCVRVCCILTMLHTSTNFNMAWLYIYFYTSIEILCTMPVWIPHNIERYSRAFSSSTVYFPYSIIFSAFSVNK